MERTDVFKNWADPTTVTVATPSLDFFQCPTTPPDSPSEPRLAYAGNCGRGPSSFNKWDGVMGDTTVPAGRMSGEDVRAADGASSTILLSERCGNKVVMAFWSKWDFLPNPNPFFTNLDPVQVANRPVPGFGIATTVEPGKVLNSQTDGAPGFRSQPSSQHPGGVNMAYCNGSVNFLKETIAPRVYAQLLSSNGGLASTLSQTTWGAGTYVLQDSDYK